jgi:hypothetical protein
MTILVEEWGDEPEEHWRVATPEEHETRGCRALRAGHRACGEAPVGAVNRGLTRDGVRHDAWWLYCSKHLYGRRVRDDRVQFKRRRVEP